MGCLGDVRRAAAGRALRVGAASAVMLAIAACSGQSAAPAPRGPSTEQQNLATVGDVMQRVEQSYMVPVGQDVLVDNALKGMLNRLDPHSNYLSAAEYQRFKSDMGGQFGGVGMQITQEAGVPKVLAPIDDTPASKAGIDPGDRIVRIDGKPTDGMSLGDVVSVLRGPVGTTVTIAIERGDKPPFDVSLTRAIIHVTTVKSKLQAGKIGYVRISAFSETTQRELVTALKALEREAGGKFAGFVLDLREDPGGELDAAVAVAGDFLEGGTVVSTRNRAGKVRDYDAPGGGPWLPADVPMVVLIDGASASAAEIVAGALQDHQRAQVMGAPSFGKGSVQTVMPLDTGGAMLLTTELYFTPAGRSIQGTGIQPDVVLALPADQQVPNPVARESGLSNALKNAGALTPPSVPPPRAGRPGPAPELDRPIKPALLGTPQDAQLKAALERLRAAAAKGGARG
jgi:carboxyl-terminal processing protease